MTRAHALTVSEVFALPALPDAPPDAGTACGIGRATWYELIAQDETPVLIIRIGRSLKVRRSVPLNSLGIEDTAAEVPSTAPAEENWGRP